MADRNVMRAALDGDEFGVGDVCLHLRGVAVRDHPVARALCTRMGISRVRSLAIEMFTSRNEIMTHPNGEDGTICLARMSAKGGKLWREIAQRPITNGGRDRRVISWEIR